MTKNIENKFLKIINKFIDDIKPHLDSSLDKVVIAFEYKYQFYNVTISRKEDDDWEDMIDELYAAHKEKNKDNKVDPELN